jgi:CubicO group peptidase (beta-lactamase class C family)
MLIGTAVCGKYVRQAAAATEPEPPLRLSEPVNAVVADLAGYIPERMREADVPGLSIALIRDGQIVWTEGFGVANTITRQPVVPETVFEVASISKVVAAYTALRLVEAGELSLDEPVASYLSEVWLPPSQYGDAITLRHLLTHTSGLTNKVDPVDKTIVFPPDETFSYSGVGFIYLQESIEQVTGRPLEDVAREHAFEPLGMGSSSYVTHGDIRPHLANGHMAYRPLLLVLAVPFAIVLVGTSLVGVVIGRVRKGRWSFSWHMLVVFSIIAAVLVLMAAALLLGSGVLKFVVLAALCVVVFGIALTVFSFAGRQIIRRLPGLQGKKRFQDALTVLWITLSVFALLGLAGLVTGPVPKEPGTPPNAAYSLRASASDLATLLIEISDPQLLDPDLGAQMCIPQARVNADNSWGLGIGIQHSPSGDSLWHTGDNPDFNSLMVIYPDQGLGVVVLTNGERGMPVAYDVAQRALGGKAEWSFYE